jgi:hypothetical protein
MFDVHIAFSVTMFILIRLMELIHYLIYINVDDVDLSTYSSNGPTTSILQPPPIDPKERKRQRARELYAQMDSDKKTELLKRKCEAHQQKKSYAWNKENVVPNEGNELRSENDMYQKLSIHMPSQEGAVLSTGEKMTNFLLFHGCNLYCL